MIYTNQSNKAKLIVDYFDEIINDPKPELKFNNEYELLVAVILSAQTSDIAVNKVTKVLFAKYKSFKDLSEANINDIKNIIYPLGLSFHKSQYLHLLGEMLKESPFPKNREELENISGVGRKTASVVLSNLHIENAFAVDTHVARVSRRLDIAGPKDTPYSIETKLNELFWGYDFYRLHHQFILFGRYTCTARKPKCDGCKLISICNYKNENGEKR